MFFKIKRNNRFLEAASSNDEVLPVVDLKVFRLKACKTNVGCIRTGELHLCRQALRRVIEAVIMMGTHAGSKAFICRISYLYMRPFPVKLYVAASRVTSWRDLRFYVDNGGSVTIHLSRNVVYKEGCFCFFFLLGR
ncbi:uncharacterized protein LOC110868784 [Helianthus annuus]|uniref:uncharacterized protein LOC110868784 n=1 Tax=Helianthus annuus TaxID=4232 RepID=UPI000B8FF6C1|nr:uncharacterized protein LOC110868784 [Helianthus annuus]